MTDESERRFREGVVFPELWKLCAGPLVDLPNPGERVVYFPQGYMEQLEASTDELLHHEILNINVDSKILCCVKDVKLWVEKQTDEVYAVIDLHPVSNQIEPTTPDAHVSKPPRPPIYSFCKHLTVSDTSIHGGLSIPRKHATDCLPSLDMNQSPPTQELITRDLHGHEWKFKHIYRGQPPRHLLTTGYNAFVTYKKVVAGDAFVFLRCGNGELGVGIRRLVHKPTHFHSPIISRHNMIVGALVTPQFALNNSTSFVINYNPRTSQFIVGLNKYLKAINNKFYSGMRCHMQVEGDNLSTIRRISGTIIGVGDLSPHWTNSEWRSLKVLWDEHTTTPWPMRVSPWEIEIDQVTHVPLNLAQPLVTSKRPKIYEIISSGDNATVQSSSSEAFWFLTQKESNDNRYFSSKMCVDNIHSSPNLDLSLNLFAQEGNQNIFMGSRPPYFPSHLQPGSSTGGFKFFSNDVPMETQSKHESIVSMRSHTKVLMEGVDIGRVVDLAALKTYDDLLVELEKLFLIKGELCLMNKWAVSFTFDKDIKLLGNDAWLQFCKMVKEIFISSRSENNEG